MAVFFGVRGMVLSSRETVSYKDLIRQLEKAELDRFETIGFEVRKAPSITLDEPFDNKGICEFSQKKEKSFLGIRALRVEGNGEFVAEKKKISEQYIMEDVITGLYGQKIPFFFGILGDKRRITVTFGVHSTENSKESLDKTLSSNIEALETSLKSAFPNIDLAFSDPNDITFNAERFFCGVMTGIPTAKIGSEVFGLEQIEKLCRGMFGERWGFLVIAVPMEPMAIIQSFDSTNEEICTKFPSIKITRQRSQAGETRGWTDLDSFANYYVNLLKNQLERLRSGKAQGMWTAICWFFSSEMGSFEKLRALLKSTFSGKKSFLEPIRTTPVEIIPNEPSEYFQIFFLSIYDKNVTFEKNLTSAPAPDLSDSTIKEQPLVNFLTSKELSTMCRPPKEELPGFNVFPTARYGVSIPKEMRAMDAKHENETVKLGQIVDRGRSIHDHLWIDKNALTKHGLIVGITGSGKTNTCFYILKQLWNELHIPFLVIEPTKSEYRALIKDIPEMAIFTPGNEMVAPFRLNPFEVPPGVRVQTHLDNLRAVFNASFTMYAPMPYVLEQAIIRVYERNGWNIAYDRHGRIPTLEDLYEEIEETVTGLGYAEEITMNVKAALQTRIRGLLLGGKGKMLNCEKSLPIEDLIGNAADGKKGIPTIIELKGIADDEEKAFLMGALFSRIYEYREACGNIGELQHVTLLEEAHRLLTNVPPEASYGEVAHSKAKAVETLCNFLTEVRAYGEGILVVDQVPTKLAMDAVKNTGLKIVHRIIAGDDRLVLSQAIGLRSEQNRHLINLSLGEAVAFFELLDEPFMIKVPASKTEAYVEDIDVSKHANEFYRRKRLTEILKRTQGPFVGCEPCESKCDLRFLTEFILKKKPVQESLIQALRIKDPKERTAWTYECIRTTLKKEGLRLEGPEKEHDMMACIMSQQARILSREAEISPEGLQIEIERLLKLFDCKEKG
jgi:hypothetical protein